MIWATDRTLPDFLYPWQTGHKEQYHIPRRVRARGTWITERRWRKAVCECEHKSFSPIAAGQFSRLQANAECAWWHSLNNTRWDATSFHHKPRVRNLRLQFFMHTDYCWRPRARNLRPPDFAHIRFKISVSWFGDATTQISRRRWAT